MRGGKLSIRWATTGDATELEKLAAASGNVIDGFQIDWTQNTGMTWLCAEDDGEMLGALQVLAGHPIGRVEILMLAEGLPRTLRMAISDQLVDRGLALLRVAGCQLATSTIGVEDITFLHIAHRKGWRETGQMTRIIKRL